MKRFAVIITFIILGSVLFATGLWNGATSGMSVDEVFNVFPNASQGNPDYYVARGNLTNGANLNNMEIGGKEYNVRFYFSNEKLDTVRLNYIASKSATEKDVDDVRLQLIKKYGPVIDNRSENNTSLRSTFYYWIKDDLKIELAHLYSPKIDSRSIWINYSTIGNTALL